MAARWHASVEGKGNNEKEGQVIKGADATVEEEFADAEIMNGVR